MADARPAIVAEGLTKRYDDLVAVDGIDLRIEEGEVFGLLGPNGAGKTTTIQMLTTLREPTSGRATVAGHDIVGDPHGVRAEIGIVFQEPSLDTILTARENLRMHGMMYGVPADAMDDRVDAMLRLVELDGRADDLVKTFSGGMKRRLELVRGIMHRPRVLFLDEPTLGLDPQTREHIWDYIEAMVARHRTTVVLTTHYMEEADRLCDRIAVIDHGRFVAQDSPADLKASMGGDVVRLTGVAPEAFVDAPHVSKVEQVDGAVLLTVEEATRHLPEILKRAGDGVTSVEVRTPTLNDVFLSLTGHALRDETEAPRPGGGHRG